MRVKQAFTKCQAKLACVYHDQFDLQIDRTGHLIIHSISIALNEAFNEHIFFPPDSVKWCTHGNIEFEHTLPNQIKGKPRPVNWTPKNDPYVECAV